LVGDTHRGPAWLARLPFLPFLSGLLARKASWIVSLYLMSVVETTPSMERQAL
jgi:hypothetical protein